MTTNGKISPTNCKTNPICVAVAVLYFGEKLLLATRLTHQHQGGKLEFVGGKIEQGETPIETLVREVKEEIGLDVGENVMTKLGRLFYQYTDKTVHLCVYQVALTQCQYQAYQNKCIGTDGQAIGFYDKTWVQSQAENFPKANVQILRWLTLPSVIVVSRALADFECGAEWVAYYAQTLAKSQTLSVRLQTDAVNAWCLISALYCQRKDIVFVIPWAIYHKKPKNFDGRILAVRLTHNELMALDLSHELCDVPILASCHDALSIQKANECVKKLPVLGVFLSPVKPTKTHQQSVALGWERFSYLADMADVPVIALGGLSVQDLPKAFVSGAVAVSGIRNF